MVRLCKLKGYIGICLNTVNKINVSVINVFMEVNNSRVKLRDVPFELTQCEQFLTRHLQYFAYRVIKSGQV
jgi:hypothetical protein